MTKLYNYTFKIDTTLYPSNMISVVDIDRDKTALKRIWLYLGVNDIVLNQLLLRKIEIGEYK